MSVAAAIERELTILNQRGLHARAAAKLCRLASGFDAEITVSRNEIDVSAQLDHGPNAVGGGAGGVDPSPRRGHRGRRRGTGHRRPGRRQVR